MTLKDGVLMAGNGPNELIFHINGEQHFSDLEHTNRLLGNFDCVHLYPHHRYSPEDEKKALAAGFIVNNDDSSIPTANAAVSATQLSVYVFDYLTQSNWMTPYIWVCQVASGQRCKAPLKPCKKEEIV